MCPVCYATKNGIKSYSVNPSNLCSPHFFEWQEEKIYDCLDTMEGLYL
jgi:hypothetical protein